MLEVGGAVRGLAAACAVAIRPEGQHVVVPNVGRETGAQIARTDLDVRLAVALHEVVAAERIPTGAAVPRGASAADLKKAFHRASLALHPDRVANAGGMDTVRRAEAVEVFKVISAASRPASCSHTEMSDSAVGQTPSSSQAGHSTANRSSRSQGLSRLRVTDRPSGFAKAKTRSRPW